MKTLVIDTATAACSVALIDGDAVIAEAHEVVGRGHAERLLPMIAALPEGGRAPRILVDCGPGSFTGVRVGIAAARALALGWGATARGYSSMALIAAAHAAHNPTLAALAVVIEGGHGEVFMQTFSTRPLAETAPVRSLPPGDAIAALAGMVAVGSGTRRLHAADAAIEPIERLPRAADARLLDAAFTTLAPSPIYGRAPDARTLAERGLA